METRRTPLRLAGSWRVAVVREPTGADELSVADSSTFAAVGLLDRLLVDEGPGCLPPRRASELCASDRDQVLAALHGLIFGDHIAATLRCGACAAPFDFDFQLSALATHVAGQAESAAPGAPGQRPPTGADEIAAASLPPKDAAAALARACVGPEAAEAAFAGLADRLARIAPVISLDLEAACPECGTINAMPFDVQGHVLGRLRAERATLIREVHRLGSAYGWSASEILALDRGLRRSFVGLIDAERTPRRPAARLGA